MLTSVGSAEQLAKLKAAARATFIKDRGFIPLDPSDVQPITLSLHPDCDEADFDAPIVSVSLGVPATFLWGGASRAVRPRRIPLEHGDVVVWGGLARLNFHGVDPLREASHELTGNVRLNLTFRRALAR